MSEREETKTELIKKVMTDVRVEAHFDMKYWGWGRETTLEELRQELQDRAKEFHEFIRDHRSQDPVKLDVIPEIEYQCPFCKSFLGNTLEEAQREIETFKNGKEGLCCCNELLDKIKSNNS